MAILPLMNLQQMKRLAASRVDPRTSGLPLVNVALRPAERLPDSICCEHVAASTAIRGSRRSKIASAAFACDEKSLRGPRSPVESVRRRHSYSQRSQLDRTEFALSAMTGIAIDNPNSESYNVTTMLRGSRGFHGNGLPDFVIPSSRAEWWELPERLAPHREQQRPG